jgi:hypothetical protein
MYTDSAVLPELFTFFQASGLYTEHIPAQNFASSLNMTLLSNSDHIPGTMQDESISRVLASLIRSCPQPAMKIKLCLTAGTEQIREPKIPVKP